MAIKIFCGQGIFVTLIRMKRRNSLFLPSRSDFGDTEGVEIATEMAPSEPLQLSRELITEHIIMSE